MYYSIYSILYTVYHKSYSIYNGLYIVFYIQKTMYSILYIEYYIQYSIYSMCLSIYSVSIVLFSLFSYPVIIAENNPFNLFGSFFCDYGRSIRFCFIVFTVCFYISIDNQSLYVFTQRLQPNFLVFFQFYQFVQTFCYELTITCKIYIQAPLLVIMKAIRLVLHSCQYILSFDIPAMLLYCIQCCLTWLDCSYRLLYLTVIWGFCSGICWKGSMHQQITIMQPSCICRLLYAALMPQ